MKIYKTIGFILILSSILLTTGCNNKNYTEANASQESSSKLELEIYETIQSMLDSNPYKGIVGKVNYEASIDDYTKKRNLLKVKVDKKNHIELFFDKTLLTKEVPLENITHLISDEAYTIAIKYKLKNPEVSIYVDGKEARE